jgi:hypothetical protein
VVFDLSGGDGDSDRRSTGSFDMRSWIHMAVDCSLVISWVDGCGPRLSTVVIKNRISSSIEAVVG